MTDVEPLEVLSMSPELAFTRQPHIGDKFVLTDRTHEGATGGEPVLSFVVSRVFDNTPREIHAYCMENKATYQFPFIVLETVFTFPDLSQT